MNNKNSNLKINHIDNNNNQKKMKCLSVEIQHQQLKKYADTHFNKRGGSVRGDIDLDVLVLVFSLFLSSYICVCVCVCEGQRYILLF